VTFGWNTVVQGDYHEALEAIPTGQVDLLVTDLPYGQTRNAWDTAPDLKVLWAQWRRILKPNGAAVFTGYGEFSARLILSAPDLYRYSLVWRKNKATGFLNAKKQPLRIHEDVLVFYRKQPTYNPQKTTGHRPSNSCTRLAERGSTNYNQKGRRTHVNHGGATDRYPTSVLSFAVVNNDDPVRQHVAQKPVALGEWIVATYTNEGDTVVDCAVGSGSFLVAAARLGRRWWGCDIDQVNVDNATRRLAVVPPVLTTN
jgi:site-specific DNA-methyltransferase (adenine-specific)